jgi:hypothetical protein
MYKGIKYIFKKNKKLIIGIWKCITKDDEEGHQEEGKLVKLWTFRPGVGKAFWKVMFLSLLLVLIETQVSVQKNEYLSLYACK